MSLKYDLPGSSNNGANPLLLDANYGFYEAQKEGQAYVYIELYSVNKSAYDPLPHGTVSTNRSNAYLVKETNYSNIGGGMITFERHFAVIPQTWFDYGTINYELLGATNNAGTETVWIVNPSDGSGTPVTTLAKVSRSYYLETNLPTLQLSNPTSSYTLAGTSWDPTQIEDVKLTPDEVDVYMGNIYVVTSYLGASN